MQEKGFYLSLGRSRYLLMYSLLAHVLAMVSVVFLSVNLFVKILMASGLVINQFLHIYRLGYLWVCNKRPVTLVNPVQEYWRVRYADNSFTSDLILVSAWVTRFAVIINFKTFNKKRLSILIVKDSVEKEPLRQLRMRLRLDSFRQ